MPRSPVCWPREGRAPPRCSSRRTSGPPRTIRGSDTSARWSRPPPRPQNALWPQRSSIGRWRSPSNRHRTSFARRGAFRPARARASALPVEWPGEVTRDWAWGGSTGKGVSVCILDSGVDAEHPLVGEVQQSVVASVGPGRRSRRRRRHRGRPLRAWDRLRRHRAVARPGVRARQRASPRRRLHGQRRSAPRRPALGCGAGLRRRQHEPLDDEEAVRRDPPRAHRHGLLPADGARRLGAQHAGGELSRGGSPRSSPSGATRSPTRSRSTTTRTRRSSSSRAVSTSRSRGREVRASAARATASRPRTCPGSAPSCSASIPS